MIKHRVLFDQVAPYLDSPEAIVITGMRRTGKTTALNFFFDRIASRNKIFLDLENVLNRAYFEEKNYERIRFSFEALGIDFSQRAYIFIDEIQFVKNLPSVVKYLVDHYRAKFFLTGSASFYLKNLFTESLAGRKYVFELYPLTFREFLIFKDGRITVPTDASAITKPIFETIAPLHDEYIQFGGFPGVVLKKSVEEKKKALDEIFSSFFQLEVLQLGDYRRNTALRQLILLLIQRVSSKLDMQKLSAELSISRPTLYEYISFLEGTYFIKLVRPFSKTRNSEIRKIPKVYVCDSGLANHFGRLDEGRIFENSIFQNLRMKGELNYYQKKSGGEVDFVLDKKSAFEVKLSATSQDLAKLQGISERLGLREFFVVAKSFSQLKNAVYGFTL